jgi:hypothetical protein
VLANAVVGIDSVPAFDAVADVEVDAEQRLEQM